MTKSVKYITNIMQRDLAKNYQLANTKETNPKSRNYFEKFELMKMEVLLKSNLTIYLKTNGKQKKNGRRMRMNVIKDQFGNKKTENLIRKKMKSKKSVNNQFIFSFLYV